MINIFLVFSLNLVLIASSVILTFLFDDVYQVEMIFVMSVAAIIHGVFFSWIESIYVLFGLKIDILSDQLRKLISLTFLIKIVFFLLFWLITGFSLESIIVIAGVSIVSSVIPVARTSILTRQTSFFVFIQILSLVFFYLISENSKSFLYFYYSVSIIFFVFCFFSIPVYKTIEYFKLILTKGVSYITDAPLLSIFSNIDRILLSYFFPSSLVAYAQLKNIQQASSFSLNLLKVVFQNKLILNDSNGVKFFFIINFFQILFFLILSFYWSRHIEFQYFYILPMLFLGVFIQVILQYKYCLHLGGVIFFRPNLINIYSFLISSVLFLVMCFGFDFYLISSVLALPIFNFLRLLMIYYYEN